MFLSTLKSEYLNLITKMEKLLILSCSNTKNKSVNSLPAIECYDGINYRVIRKSFREKNIENLDIAIISAKYGLLNPADTIEYYDMKMTKQRALDLRQELLYKLKNLLVTKDYSEIFVNLGKNYLLAIDGFEEHLSNDQILIYAKGGIGQKASQMKKWILGLNPEFN